jgi:hypothetical protein
MPAPLKLLAFDAEDLEALAACLQDALVPIGDMAYLPEEKRFVLVLNRFCWECGVAQYYLEQPADPLPRPDHDVAESEAPFERVHAGLCFEGVTRVRRRGIDWRRDRILSLLTIRLEEGRIYLIFAGGAMVELTVESVRCRMEDLDEAWPTRWRPRHAADEEGHAAE